MVDFGAIPAGPGTGKCAGSDVLWQAAGGDVFREDHSEDKLLHALEKKWKPNALEYYEDIGCLFKAARPIHCAAYRGYAQGIHRLVACKAKVNARCGHGFSSGEESALHIAINHNSCGEDAAATCKALLESRADPMQPEQNNWPPLQYLSARSRNRVECEELVQTLVDFKADANFHNDRFTPLQVAVHEKVSVSILHALVAAGARVDEPLRAGGNTPLCMAALVGNDEHCVFLLEARADVNGISDGAQKTKSPLVAAVVGITDPFCYSGDNGVKCVELLVEHHADPGWADEDGKTALDQVQPDSPYTENLTELLCQKMVLELHYGSTSPADGGVILARNLAGSDVASIESSSEHTLDHVK